jgi:DNA-binding transcriptional LysR family regulator
MLYIPAMQDVHLAGIDLNLLVALDALLETRHVTRASQRLGLSQSATSHALSRLRELLGDPLLVRTGAALVPTPRALELEPDVRAILDSIRRTLSAAPFDPAATVRSFSIATADYIELVMMPSLISEIARVAPGVDVVVRPPPEESASLASSKIDLLIGVGLPAAPSIHRRALLEDGYSCVVRAGHPVVRKGLDLDRFVELGHVFITVLGTRGGAVDEALARKRRKRRVVAMVSSFLAAPAIVAESDLVLTMPTRLALRLAPAFDLKVLEPPVPLPRYQIAMYWHERMQRDPSHTWLRRMLVEHARSLDAE